MLTSPGNGIIADKLREMADILGLQHEDGFRIAAYRRAARTLMAFDRLLDEIVRSQGLEGLMKLANPKSPIFALMIFCSVGTAAQAGQNAPAGLLESLQRTLVGTPSGQVDQAAVQDITRLLGQRFTQGEWTPQQRDQLANDVAKVANISPDDARRRLDEAQNTINATVAQAEQKLRQAAEATRQAIATRLLLSVCGDVDWPARRLFRSAVW